MRCHQCNGVMQEIDRVDDRGVSQVWYGCPVCEARHTVVEPSEIRFFRMGSLQRCCGGPATMAGAQRVR